MNFARCLPMVFVIRKHTDVFRGIFLVKEGGSLLWRIFFHYVGGIGGFAEGIFHGERKFYTEGALDFPALFKKMTQN